MDARGGENSFLLGRWSLSTAAQRYALALASHQARPFHITGGLDLRIAQAAVALAIAPFAQSPESTSNPRMKNMFFDPCCGSGTMLLTALQTWSHALHGIAARDINPAHLCGALQNLKFAGLEAEGLTLNLDGCNGEKTLATIGMTGFTEATLAESQSPLLLHAAVTDAAAGEPLPQPPGTHRESGLWRLVGVANLAWGQKQAATPDQVRAFLSGLRQTLRASLGSSQSCRFCFVLGPDVDVTELFATTQWTLMEGQQVEVFRSNNRDLGVLCKLAVATLL
ncbi:unnamed protein product [Polarella glacialis]|uniref:Uncharacterized protein n=1 Tax=Polarella glacialis TaxID=89957 RepID=A0A813E0K7_POLGL|nr:unnamed protein product [Polarella glacialis]